MENNQLWLVQVHLVCNPNIHRSNIHFLKSPEEYADILAANLPKSYIALDLL